MLHLVVNQHLISVLKYYIYSCTSFCQTWLRNTGEVGAAQFSVMSPHFQTRFYVSDENALKECSVTDKMIQSYAELINFFTGSMQKDYGLGGGGQAFINLDSLATLVGT